MITKMTIQRAIEEGYKMYCVYQSDEPAQYLADLKPEDIGTQRLVLLGKDLVTFYGMDEDGILDHVGEQIFTDFNDVCATDNDDIELELKSIDKNLLTPYVNAIRAIMEKHKYYEATEIFLIK